MFKLVFLVKMFMNTKQITALEWLVFNFLVFHPFHSKKSQSSTKALITVFLILSAVSIQNIPQISWTFSFRSCSSTLVSSFKLSITTPAIGMLSWMWNLLHTFPFHSSFLPHLPSAAISLSKTATSLNEHAMYITV